MRYFVFIDESGEANISQPDPRFNIFVLCGILFREDHYKEFDKEFRALKIKYFSSQDVVFHSIKMRKNIGAFKVFQDKSVLNNFYVDIGKLFTEHKYTVISCIVDKGKYRVRYPTKNYAYEDSLTFLCERAISLVGKDSNPNTLHFCLEKRDERKDTQLKKIYTSFVKYGTEYVSTQSFKVCNPELFFRGKHDNINGLQFADLCAYPIARKTLSPETPQPTFDLFENKIFNPYGKKKGFGLKYFP